MLKNIPKIIVYSLFAVFMIIIVISIFKENEVNKGTQNMNALKATILEITFDNTNKEEKFDGVNAYKYQEFQIEINEGKHKGETYWMRNTVETADVYNIYLEEGEHILVSVTENQDGKIDSLHIYDKQRENHIYLLIGVFFGVVLLIGGYQGVKSIVTLCFTGFMIIKVLVPLVLSGHNPILITIITCTIITCLSIIVIAGISKKTISAILGTIGGVLIAGIIATIIGYTSQITGLANENMQSLVYLLKYPEMDFRGILFSGIIIGALGAVMDVSMSISSSMNEICEIKPDITRKELLKSGMNIGKDIMGSMSNTLILAYTGSAIELMLLFKASNLTMREIINLDMVASEIIKGISGSVGLACTIPLTVIICGLMHKVENINTVKN